MAFFILQTKEFEATRTSREVSRHDYDLSHDYNILTDPTYEHSDTAVTRKALLDDHDYSEPYFEPASEVEDLFHQLIKLEIPNIKRDNLRYNLNIIMHVKVDS